MNQAVAIPKMTLETILRKHIDQLDPSNKREFRKKTIELCHLAKFILSVDEGYSIASVGESPDIIIANGNNKIGVEHVILAETSHKKREGSIENLFKLAENDFSIAYPEKKFLVNIFLTKNFPIIKKLQSQELIPIINKTINIWIETKILIENDLIESIYSMPHTEMDFVANKGAWGSGVVTIDLLRKTIREKDKLVNKYRTNTRIDKQWLLIVIGGVGESSYQMNNSITGVFNSDFDRIYVLEDFNWIINRIK